MDPVKTVPRLLPVFLQGELAPGDSPRVRQIAGLYE